MRKMIQNIIALAVLTAALMPGQAGASPLGHSQVKVDVWLENGFDSPYCSDDDLEVFIRPRRDAYVTVMIIDPNGYANVVYPERPRRQRKLWGGEVYRLSRLLHDDDPLYFYGLEGTAYISVIATRRPVFLNDWLLDEISDFCDDFRYASPGFRVGFGSYGARLEVSWNNHLLRFGYSAFTRPIILRRNAYIGRPHHHNYDHKRRWNKRWSYRSQRPLIVYEKRDRDDHYYPKKTYPKKWDQKKKSDRRDYDRRQNRDRDDTYGLRKGKSRDTDRTKSSDRKVERTRPENNRREVKSRSKADEHPGASSKKVKRGDTAKSKSKAPQEKTAAKKTRKTSKSGSDSKSKKREKKNE